MYDYDYYLTMKPTEFLQWLNEQFIENIPLAFDTYEDLQKIGNQIGTITNRYAYIAAFLSYTKIQTRNLKRMGVEYKAEYEDMMDRRDALQHTAETLKLQYQSMSRLITIRQEINKELNMGEI